MANANLAAPYIEMGEGGLSRASTDSASANPAPWSYDGKTGWHTNRGITYAAFSSNAAKLGYANTPDNFFKMPDEIWTKIFKQIYWDSINADKITSDALAIYAVSWVWGSGVSGGSTRLKTFLTKSGISYATIAEGINSLKLKFGELKALEMMLESRKQQFIALGQPANLQGWLNRLEKYRIGLTELIQKKKP